MARIGIYGGSFDPIHLGHLAVAAQAFAQGRLDRLVFAPALEPPHKPGMRLADFAHRCAMVARATAGHHGYVASDVEASLPRPSYTIRTVAALTGPGDLPVLIVGADSVAGLPRWYRATELLARCELLVAPRPGFAMPQAGLGPELPADRLVAAMLAGPPVEISSTEVRARLSRGESVRDLVPDAVAAYLRDHDLYRG